MSAASRLRAREMARRRLSWRCRTCDRTRAEVDALVVLGFEVCAACWAELAGPVADLSTRAAPAAEEGREERPAGDFRRTAENGS